MSTSNLSVSREKVVEDAKVLAKDVQELLKETASVVGEKASEARSRVQESLKVVQEKVAAATETVKAKGKQAIAATDDYVHENPWKAVGIAAGVGFLLGIGFAAGTFLRRRDLVLPMSSESGDSGAGSSSLFANLRSFWGVLVAILHTRLDLAKLELEEAGIHALRALMTILFAFFFLGLTVFFFLFFLVVVFWDQRVIVLGSVSAVCGVLSVVFILAARHLIQTRPRFLGQTLDELRRDAETLRAKKEGS